MAQVSELIKKLPYWNSLTPEEQKFLEANTALRTYPKGTYLRGCGESCLGMIHVLSGSIRALMISGEGREITLYHLYPGDSCVLSAFCVLNSISFETQMVAAEDLELLVVNAGAYGKLLEKNLSVRCFTYELANVRSSTVIWVLQQILFNRFDRRLAAFFIAGVEKTGSTEIRMTQEEIAREVNTAREVVARMLRQFAADGWIEVRRGVIELKDLAALRKVAE